MSSLVHPAHNHLKKDLFQLMPDTCLFKRLINHVTRQPCLIPFSESSYNQISKRSMLFLYLRNIQDHASPRHNFDVQFRKKEEKISRKGNISQVSSYIWSISQCMKQTFQPCSRCHWRRTISIPYVFPWNLSCFIESGQVYGMETFIFFIAMFI